MEELKRLIREVPDFPNPGILFYDITTLLKDAEGFRSVIDGLKRHYQNAHVDTVLGIEARGFIFAPALAYALGAGFVPVRKPKKLPAECVTVTYDLEYGSDSLEMHKDAIGKGHRVLIVDDNRAIHDDFRKILCASPVPAGALEHAEAMLFDSPARPADWSAKA